MKSARVFPFAVLVFLSLLLAGVSTTAQADKPDNQGDKKEKPAEVTVQADGTVEVPAESVPVSKFLSPEAKAYLTQHLHDMQDPKMTYAEKGVPRFMMPYLERQKTLFAVDLEDTKIAGVHAFVYTPKAGTPSKNKSRVLINLHGGGFSGCWPGCAELESRPIAALGEIKVVSLDYRQGPENKFPAASEDVAAVYKELLKAYKPESIGIYGCSAGGMLTTMSVAWFQRHDLPRPGAIGVLCASAGEFGGDAAYTSTPLGEARLMPEMRAGGINRLGYFSNTDPNDPLVAPIHSPEMLAKFPPTLILTGTRAFEMSSAVYTHSQLVKLGVDAELHVWEGLFHGFFYNPDVPESRDAYDVIVKFFDRHLGVK
jgi:monoterpene epsilon-lactone hydrolase